MICLARTPCRAALRHVLDSSWVAMGQMDKTVQGRFQPDASWRAFADKITPYGELDRAQQAAIVAMRGVLELTQVRLGVTVLPQSLRGVVFEA